MVKTQNTMLMSRIGLWKCQCRSTLPCTPSSPQNSKYECESAKRMKLFFDGLALKKLDELPAAKWKDRQVIVVGKLHRADTAGEMTPIYMDVTSISAPKGAAPR